MHWNVNCFKFIFVNLTVTRAVTLRISNFFLWAPGMCLAAHRKFGPGWPQSAQNRFSLVFYCFVRMWIDSYILSHQETTHQHRLVPGNALKWTGWFPLFFFLWLLPSSYFCFVGPGRKNSFGRIRRTAGSRQGAVRVPSRRHGGRDELERDTHGTSFRRVAAARWRRVAER